MAKAATEKIATPTSFLEFTIVKGCPTSGPVEFLAIQYAIGYGYKDKKKESISASKALALYFA